MRKDQILGLLTFGISIILMIAYGWLIFATEYALVVMKLTCFLMISSVLSILAWIGFKLSKTPHSRPVEDIEMEIERELKKLDEE